MCIVLDECIDERFRHLLASHDCQTARYAGLAGSKNGTLSYAAAAAGFDAVVTADQSMSGSTELPHSSNRPRDPLRAHQPASRLGTAPTSDITRAQLDRARPPVPMVSASPLQTGAPSRLLSGPAREWPDDRDNAANSAASPFR